jgi:hypothetical protein
MFEPLKAIARFYTTSQTVEIESRFDAAQSVERLLQLNDEGEVSVTQKKDGRIVVGSWSHGRKPNALAFTGTLEGLGPQVVLRGVVGLDPGMRSGLGILFFIVCIFFPLRLGVLLGGTQHSAFPGAEYVAALGFLAFLAYGYRLGKDTPTRIVSRITKALRDEGNA